MARYGGNISRRRLLYHCPITTGGLAAYAHEQACALAAAGCEVTLATRTDYAGPTDVPYRILRMYPAEAAWRRSLPRFVRRPGTLWSLLREQFRLAAYIKQQKFMHVLMASYIEYAAPLWAWQFRQLARQGRVFGAIVHDPVRDYVVGPLCWHRLSIASGYSFLSEAFVHGPITLETGQAMQHLRTTVIPHGPYRYPPSTRPRAVLRQAFGLPEAATVLLAFGHLRDGKNLHLAIEALAHFPDVHLLVAGSESSGIDRPGAYYQELARCAGAADRCHWMLRYIADTEVGELFEAADLILLTYSQNFRSASGVLNAAVAFRKPSLVSSGDSNLKLMVRRYGLGVWVEPDDPQAIRTGLQVLRTAPPIARWHDYELEQSWRANAALVIDRLFQAQAPNVQAVRR